MRGLRCLTATMTRLRRLSALLSAPLAARLGKCFRPHLSALALGIGALCLGSGCALVFPVLAGALIDAIGKAGGVQLTSGLALRANEVGAGLIAIVGVQA